MAVPEQTPFIEYTANGTTTVYPLTFDCDKSEYLIVSLDGEEAPVGSWTLTGGSITFNSAPANGVLITIERNTPFRRTTEYQSYNNSFRPSPVNKDFDLIWWKLQELGYRDQVIWLALVKEIADRIAGDDNLQNQINTIDEWLANLQQNVNENTNDIAQLVTDLSKEIADRIANDEALKEMFLAMMDEAINEGTINALAVTHVDSLEALEGVTNVWDGRTIYIKDLGNYRYDALTASWVKAYQDSDNVMDGSETQKQINNKTIQYVDSISELRLLNPRKDGQEVFLVQHTSEGRGAGWFVWDAFDTQIDNNGTIVKRDGVVVGSWKRRFTTLKTDDFGLHEATGDTTAILQLIDSLADTIVVNNGEYLISDFKPSKKYIFEDNAWFKTNTTATSNGVIAQTGLKMIRPKIKHNVSVAPTDGDYGNAIRIGTYRQANDLTVSVHDVVIDASEIQLINTTNVGQGIEILGNAYDVTISRPIIKGKGFGIICHWGGDVGEDGHSSTVTYSYHPHDIKIIDPEFYSTATDATGRMQTGLILSACYDVEVTNIKSDGVATTLYNFVGDVYNQVAVDRDKDKVCTNVKIDGVNIDNFVDGSTPVQAIGYSATVRTAQGMTIAIDDDQYMQMSMKGIVITSRNAANTSDLILVSGVKNVDFEAEIVGVEHDGRFARIQANQDCSIKITGSSKRGFINRGNHNTDITVNSVYKTKSRVPSERGMEIQSYEFVTSSFNAPQGSTSLSFSVATTTLLYKGSLVLKNNIPVGQVTKTAYFESGVVNTVQIDGLSEAITTSDAVKILRANDGCVVTGVIANYYNNVYGTNPVGTIIQSKLYGGYNGNIMFDGAYLINVDITDCKLEKVGLENSSMSCVDITVDSATVRGLRINDNKFDQNLTNPKANQRIYIDTKNHSGVTISRNIASPCLSSIPVNIKPSTAPGYKQQAQIFANSFGDVNTTVATAYSGFYVGNTYTGFVRTNYPSSGVWNVGDRLLKENAVIGQTQGWICTTGGASPSWTPLANI
ncbi:TPA: hypothetical protein ACVB6Z_000360 [Acinetobacter baumannii]